MSQNRLLHHKITPCEAGPRHPTPSLGAHYLSGTIQAMLTALILAIPRSRTSFVTTSAVDGPWLSAMLFLRTDKNAVRHSNCELCFSMERAIVRRFIFRHNDACAVAMQMGQGRFPVIYVCDRVEIQCISHSLRCVRI